MILWMDFREFASRLEQVVYWYFFILREANAPLSQTASLAHSVHSRNHLRALHCQLAIANAAWYIGRHASITKTPALPEYIECTKEAILDRIDDNCKYQSDALFYQIAQVSSEHVCYAHFSSNVLKFSLNLSNFSLNSLRYISLPSLLEVADGPNYNAYYQPNSHSLVAPPLEYQ